MAGSFDGTITVLDITTSNVQHTFELPGEMVVSVAVSSDGSSLAAVTWQGKAHVWDLPKRNKLHTLVAIKEIPETSAIAEALAFAPDGKTFVTGSWDTTLRLWNTETGKPVRDLIGHRSAIHNAAFAPDGKTLATTDAQGRLLLWNPATGEQLASLNAHTDRCFGLAFSSDGKRFATASWDRTAKIWDTETRMAIATLTRDKPKD